MTGAVSMSSTDPAVRPGAVHGFCVFMAPSRESSVVSVEGNGEVDVEIGRLLVHVVRLIEGRLLLHVVRLIDGCLLIDGRLLVHVLRLIDGRLLVHVSRLIDGRLLVRPADRWPSAGAHGLADRRLPANRCPLS